MTTQTGQLGSLFFPSAKRRDTIGFVFVAFFGIPFLLFNLLPVFFGAYVSLTEWGIVGQPQWVGLDNYREGLSDPAMIQAFLNTLLYALIIVPSVTVLGLLAALYVNQGWPLSSLTRTLFFAPHVVSATVIGLVWVWIFDTRFGILNLYLGQVGLQPVPWLTSTDWSLLSVSIASIWWDLGLAFILLLAALKEVPRELYEAGRIDGAQRWHLFRHVTLPHLRPVLSMVVTLQLIATLRIFSQVYVMTGGGPAGSSNSVIHYVYMNAMVFNVMGYAAAISILLFLVIIMLTMIETAFFRGSRRG